MAGDTAHSLGRCYLLELSAELRNAIWEWSLYEAPGIHLFVDPNPGRYSTARFETCVRRTSSGWNLVLACRQTYAECAAMFYRVNTFNLHAPFVGCGEGPGPRPHPVAPVIEPKLQAYNEICDLLAPRASCVLIWLQPSWGLNLDHLRRLWDEYYLPPLQRLHRSVQTVRIALRVTSGIDHMDYIIGLDSLEMLRKDFGEGLRSSYDPKVADCTVREDIEKKNQLEGLFARVFSDETNRPAVLDYN